MISFSFFKIPYISFQVVVLDDFTELGYNGAGKYRFQMLQEIYIWRSYQKK